MRRSSPIAIKLMAAAAREWGPDMGVITCSLDVKQAFDYVSPETKPELGDEGNENCSCAGEVHQTRREGESVLVQPDDEKCPSGFLQDEWKRMRTGVRISGTVSDDM